MGDARHSGSVLLLDDIPCSPSPHAQALTRNGFKVHFAASLLEAERVWKKGAYSVVLVALTRELVRAAEFCDRIKEEDPEQMIGMLVPPDAELPPTRCPDLIWPHEDLEHFVARVRTLSELAAVA